MSFGVALRCILMPIPISSGSPAGAWVKQAAQAAGIPVFSIKSAGVGDVVKALRTLLGIDPSPGGLFADEGAPVAGECRCW